MSILATPMTLEYSLLDLLGERSRTMSASPDPHGA
jgi:hypothetical protein